MTSGDPSLKERHFVEEMGLFFEESGATRMMGRILGRLLVCRPAHQSSAELADYLQVSRGAISMTTRQLMMGGLIERVPVPNDRSTYFRIDSRGWVNVMRARLGFLTLMREIAERGLDLLADAEPPDRARLQEFRDFYAFCEERFPSMFDAWQAQQRSGPR